ncbi:MAG TPA: cell division protein FtsL [Candidatus Binatia bacterium]|nr:cell division protein FtsL [Candidatus Binatia bacterium]
MSRKKGSRSDFHLAILVFFIFAVLFIYSSLNLKNVDLGYQQHDMLQQEEKLRADIDRLQAQKALLQNLERMEKVAIEKLGYQYPQAEQIIQVVEADDED